jgi:hypothetical protein
MVEIWFGIIERQAIRRGSFTSIADLTRRSAPSSTAGTPSHPFIWTKPADDNLTEVNRKQIQRHATTVNSTGFMAPRPMGAGRRKGFGIRVRSRVHAGSTYQCPSVECADPLWQVASTPRSVHAEQSSTTGASPPPGSDSPDRSGGDRPGSDAASTATGAQEEATGTGAKE